MGTYPNGLFTWTDISLPDPVGGSKFYSELFGWQAEDQHDPEGNYIYTMFERNGHSVAGLGPQPEAMQNQGIPPMWQSYVAVDSVAETLEKVAANGGTIVMPALQVMASGTMAIIADSQGGVVSLWEEGEHMGASAFNSHGQLTWNELATRDSAAARAFYGAVFGWTFEQAPTTPAEYWMIVMEGKPQGGALSEDKYNGGIITMDEEWPAEIPQHWMVYFSVDDTDAALGRLAELGGTVSVPAFDSSAGRIAVVADPQGGTFSIISPPAGT